ncbi:Bug family tripartite tricarboxylate transporter substrate binding protein [Propylenella binzhouense]|nr:tripartite tricarboxylate transporter substrate binding protein [Propylenella binzhouense]
MVLRMTRRAALRAFGGLTAIGLALAAAGLAQPVLAQSGAPKGPVRIIVGFPPGGGADLLARLLAPELQQSFGQPVVVENRPGAQGRIGTDLVAKAEPDGQTILMATEGAIVILPHLPEPLPYDPLKDLAPVSLVVRTTPVIVANPSVEADSLKDLIADAKANPGKYFYGHSGVGGPNHLMFELLKQKTGAKIEQVPYQGTGAVIPAVLSNEVPLAIGYLPSFVPYIKAGTVKPLAVTSGERASAMPDIVTVADAGVPDFDMSSWLGMFVPAGTPAETVTAIRDAVVAALQKPEVRKSIQSGGQEIVGSTPEAFAKVVQSGSDNYRDLIKTLDLPKQ